MITLQSIIKEETQNIIQNFLIQNNIIDTNTIGIPMGFIGGSQRFKFETNFSDLDLFYYSSMAKDIRVNNILYFNGFNIVDSYQDQHTKNSMVSIGWFHKILNVHVILISDFNYFMNLKQEHERVSKYLEKNSETHKFIKTFKQLDRSIKGRFIYRSLLKMI